MELFAILGSLLGLGIVIIILITFIAMYFRLDSINETLKKIEKQQIMKKN